MGLESRDIQHGIETRTTSVVVRSSIPQFVHSKFKPDLPEGLLRARVSTAMMQIRSPFFTEDEIGYQSDLALRPTGLEGYGIGQGINETVRFIANEGTRDQRRLRKVFAEQGFDPVKRADELLDDGEVDPRHTERDYRVLIFEDVSAAILIATFKGGMSRGAEEFRDETHRLVGDVRSRYSVEGEGSSRVALISVPIVSRQPTNENVNWKRVSLRDTLNDLTSQELAGWVHMVRLFGGTIKGPHARLYLGELRSTFLPL